MAHYKPYKMKGHTLPGINQKSEPTNMPDGKSKSSPFQQNENDQDSPNKWVQFIPMALSAISSMKKDKK